jgi:hypothetical protein
MYVLYNIVEMTEEYQTIDKSIVLKKEPICWEKLSVEWYMGSRVSDQGC